MPAKRANSDISPSSTAKMLDGRASFTERQRRATVTKADGQRQAAIAEADGRLEASRRDAEAQIVLARGSEQSIRLIDEAVGRA